MKIILTVDPKFCGPVSVGTIGLIKLVQKSFDLGLAEAKSLVDKAVFGGEIVEIQIPEHCKGSEIISEIELLDSEANIQALLVESDIEKTI